MQRNLFMLAAAFACGTVASAQGGQRGQGSQGGQGPDIPAAERAAIIKAALDYGDGFYSGAAERMERAIHPDLNKVVVRALPQTGKYVVQYSTYSGLIEMTRAKVGFREPEQRKIQGDALTMNGDVACAKVTSAMFDDFLSMVKVGDQWLIVNVLWAPGPDTPNRPAVPVVDVVKDKEAITRAAADFTQGLLSSDAALLEKVLHPEASMAVFSSLTAGWPMINRIRYSGIVEPARAKLSVAPAGAPAPEIRILDVMDGMAFVEVMAANSVLYVQMMVLDGQWKIFNVLTKRLPPRR